MDQKIPITTEPARTKINANFKGDETEARWKAVSDPRVVNPLEFKDQKDRSAATLARAGRIMNDPKFKALGPNHKQAVLSNYYDKYVKPAYEMGGLDAPNKELWLREAPKETSKLSPEFFYTPVNTRQALDTFAGASSAFGKVFDGVMYGGLALSKEEAKFTLGLGHFFTHNPDYSQEKERKDVIEYLDKGAKQKIDNMSHALFDRDNFWLQTHPSKQWTDHIDSFVGEQLIQLPLYEAIGGARLAAAGKVQDILPAKGMVYNLSQKLATSKVGQFVARRLGDGADAYIGATLQNAKSDEKISQMAAFMGFGALGEGAFSAVSIPTKGLIKKFTAKNIAMGGTFFQEAITDQADHELMEQILGHNHQGHEVKIVPGEGEAGHIQVANRILPYSNQVELQAHIDGVIKHHAEIDPVKASLVNAEKMTLSAMGRQKYSKSWNQLSQAQRRVIREQRSALTEEAVNEAPLHNQDLVKQHITTSLAQEAKENPAFGNRVAEFEKASGIKVSDVLHDTEAEQIAEETGVKNSQDTIAKVASIKKTPKQMSAPLLKQAREQEPRKFAQFKVDTLAYFKNYAPKGQVPMSGQALAAQIKDMDSEEFTSQLQYEMGSNNIKFENPEHALLWANRFRMELPKPFQTRLISELHDINPDETIKTWDEQSKNLDVHMEELAHVGRLFSQGNVFRSTQVDNWLDKTQWQKQLRGETEVVELKQLSKVLAKHPEVRKMATTLTKKLQKARSLADNADTYHYVSSEIRGAQTVRDWKRKLGVN
jgi:hypothetical protein